MLDYTVFYSWQYDSPKNCNMNFIEDCIERALKQINKKIKFQLSPRLDRDTQDVAGAPPIADTILRKISECGMIVADLTLVSYTDDQFTLKSLLQTWAKNRFNWSATVQGIHSTKRSPNANVMLELGYAVGILGWDRVICVMNDHFGKPDDLPFDVRHRRFPFVYTLSPTPGEAKAEVRKKLVAKLVEGIEAAEAADHASAQSAIASMDIDCLLVCSLWRKLECFRDLDQDPPNRDQLAPVLSISHFRRAIVRLLELRLLRTDVQGENYAYWWTFLGRIVLSKLFPGDSLIDDLKSRPATIDEETHILKLALKTAANDPQDDVTST
jgi:hypothetical protein